jgi:polyisoprenoid-binding protein YceI
MEKYMRKRLALIYLFSFLIGVVFPGDWQVNKDATNTVIFYSSTPVLDFEGTTDSIDGYIYWEGDSLFGDKNEIYFELALNTFETGIGKRDRDMRDDVLQTDKFPLASFRGNFIHVKKSGVLYSVIVEGEMDLHGIKKRMKINGEIQMSENRMNLKSHFSIFLKDFEIEAPSLMAFFKVADEIKLELDLSLINKSN